MEDKYEVNLTFKHGSVTLNVGALFHGPGEIDQGVESMIWEMFPNALSVAVYERPDEE